MENFGETLRSIRLNKGLTQKYLYQDVLSKSYAIRFEQGKHDISFVLLLEILDRLPMEVSEFLYIHQGYQPSESQWFYTELQKSGNRMDLAGLAALKEAYQRRYPASRKQASRLLQVDYRWEQLHYYGQNRQITEDVVTPELQAKIQRLLAATQSWTMEDLRFFAATLDLVPTSDLTLFFQGLLPSLKRYRQFEAGKNVLCILLINALHKAFFSESYGIARELLALLEDFADGLDYLAYRNFSGFYSGLLQLVGRKAGQPEYEAGLASARQASAIFRQLQYPFYEELTQDILQAFLAIQGV